jgi:hypothetical protein
MTPFKKQFAFEDKKAKLIDGTEFLPLRDAIRRWYTARGNGPQIWNYDFEILYELPRCQFLLVEYGPCDPELKWQGWFRRRSLIWEADSTPHAGFLDPALAYDLFLAKFPEEELPESLRQFEEEYPAEYQPLSVDCEEAVRPLEYWVKQRQLRTTVAMPAKFATTHEGAVTIYLALLRFRQLARLWRHGGAFPNYVSLERITEYLCGNYVIANGVSSAESENVKRARLPKLGWPEGLEEVGQCLAGIAEFMEPPLRCLQFRMLPSTSPHRPTPTELQIAQDDLRARMPYLEKCLDVLGELLNDADIVEEMQLREKEWAAASLEHCKEVERPNDRFRMCDFRAYRAYRYALANMRAKAEPSDKDVYEWLKQYGCEWYYPGEELPKYETWVRYRDYARSAIKRTKHDPLDESNGKGGLGPQ